MVSGTVKIYNSPWKFGFIVKNDGGQVFFHGSGVTLGPVCKDDLVEYDIDDSPRGPRAVNIRKI